MSRRVNTYVKVTQGGHGYGIAKIRGIFDVASVRDNRVIQIPNAMISYFYFGDGCVKMMIHKKDTTVRWKRFDDVFTDVTEISYGDYMKLRKEILSGLNDQNSGKYLSKYKV